MLPPLSWGRPHSPCTRSFYRCYLTNYTSLPLAILRPTNQRQQIRVYRECLQSRQKILSIGNLVGLIMAGLASSVPRFLPRFLTNDALVQTAVRPLALALFLGALLLAPVAVCEGVLLK